MAAIDTSSAIAALRPAPSPFSLKAHHSHAPMSQFTSMPFNFALHRPRAAELTAGKSFRIFSPASTLAADISLNCRIDDGSSPRLPTPRRALFTSGTMATGDEPRSHYLEVSPPSPVISNLVDLMDVSPVFQTMSMAQLDVDSPCPITYVQTSVDEMMIDSPVPAQPPVSLEPAKPILERKKTSMRRPSLSRAKGYTTGSIANKLQGSETPVSFRLGGEAFSPMNLTDGLDDSPLSDRRSLTENSPCPSGLPSRARIASLCAGNSSRTSAAASHLRRPSNPFARPRKHFRRSLSMFENPGEVIKLRSSDASSPSTTTTTPLQPVPDVLVEESQELILPHYLPEGQNDNIPRISKNTVIDVLDGKYNEHYDQKIVIDCRFEYEYEGGHIDGAVNCNDKETLASQLFKSPLKGRTLLVFHCEYSAHRAPIMARHIRAEDRSVNADNYPRLTYPEIYILDGGYSAFFAEYRARCFPQAYVEMDSAEHIRTCEREMSRLRQTRKGLNRAQTFAFGQQDYIDNSPTTAGRSSTIGDSLMTLGSPMIDLSRVYGRRMASY